MRRLVTTVAAIALIAGTAHAQGNGKGGGQGGGKGGGGHQTAQGGGGGGKPDRAGRGQDGGGMQAAGNQDRGNGGRGQGGRGEARGGSGQGGGGHDREFARSNGGQGGGNQAVGGPREGGGSKDRGNVGRGGGNDRDVARGNDRGDLARGSGRGHDRAIMARGKGRGDNDVIVGRWRDVDVIRVNNFDSIRGRALVAGCPPGLAKKNPPCVPPGQVRSAFRGYDRPDFWGMPWLGAGRYFYDDGFLMRLGPDGRIGGYIPLLGGALAVGNVWPSYYQPVAVPAYYESYYGLGPYSAYRYADNVIYRVDPETAAITSIAALLTGDDFVVGQPMPIGYDVYNVPYAYRTQYYDRPDALYRYSDGYVYQIDPETRLIAAAIELIAS